MAQTDSNKNERLALLLGWERVGWVDPGKAETPGWLHEASKRGYPHPEPPDYDQWERFPELQAYVRGLGQKQQWEIVIRADREMSKNAAYSILGVTPAILGDALLEVCDA